MKTEKAQKGKKHKKVLKQKGLEMYRSTQKHLGRIKKILKVQERTKNIRKNLKTSRNIQKGQKRLDISKG